MASPAAAIFCMWLGQTDAAIEALELAQRIDPELNAIDRFALSLAYYLKRRYDAAIEQAETQYPQDGGCALQPRRAGGGLCPAATVPRTPPASWP